MSKAGRRVRALRGISFQNILGVSLLHGGMNSTFLGKLDWTGLFWGSFDMLPGGSDSFECLIYRRGTIFRPRLPGMLVMNIYIYAAGEVLRSTGGYSISLRLITLLGECIDLLTHSLGN